MTMTMTINIRGNLKKEDLYFHELKEEIHTLILKIFPSWVIKESDKMCLFNIKNFYIGFLESSYNRPQKR